MTREEAIKRMEICRNFLANNYSDMGEPNFTAFNMAIKVLEQEPKIGHWIIGRISPTKIANENLIEYRCSECDRVIRCTESQLVNYPYCHCGAKMEREVSE